MVAYKQFAHPDNLSPEVLSKKSSEPSAHVYVTWDKFEVDRWVAAWLIKRFIDPSAEFRAVPTGSGLSEADGILFDVPGGRWSRGPNSSASEKVFAEIKNNDPALTKMLGLVRKLELAYWRLSPKDSQARRLHDSLLRIFREADEHSQRTQAMFEYLDQVYRDGGTIP